MAISYTAWRKNAAKRRQPGAPAPTQNWVRGRADAAAHWSNWNSGVDQKWLDSLHTDYNNAANSGNFSNDELRRKQEYINGAYSLSRAAGKANEVYLNDTSDIIANTVPFAHDFMLENFNGATTDDFDRQKAELYGQDVANNWAGWREINRDTTDIATNLALWNTGVPVASKLLGRGAQAVATARGASAARAADIALKTQKAGNKLFNLYMWGYEMPSFGYKMLTADGKKINEQNKLIQQGRAQDPNHDQNWLMDMDAERQSMLDNAINNGDLDPDDAQQMAEYTNNINGGILSRYAETGSLPTDVWSSDAFASLPVETQKNIIHKYMSSRVQAYNLQHYGENFGGHVVSAYDWVRNKFSPGSPLVAQYENDPELRGTMQTIMQNGSPALLNELAGNGFNGDPNSRMMQDVSNIVTQRVADDPNFGVEAALYQRNDGTSPMAGNTQIMRQVIDKINAVGMDKWMAGMSSGNFLRMANVFMTNPEGLAALDEMGEDGAKFKQAMIDAAKKAAFGHWMKDLRNTHLYASLWFRSKGFDQLATAAESPGLFYGGLAALAIGGGLMLFGSDGGSSEQRGATAQQEPAETYNYRRPNLDVSQYS